MLKRALLTLTATVMVAPAVTAKDDFIMDTSSIGRSHNGVVSSEQFLELGMRSANALRLEGENSMRMGNLDRSIMVLQKSVEMAPLDMDGRILYAQALEQKLISQRERDPKLFNFCVKQWLFVYKKADFPDQQMQARAHIVNLTGVMPRWLQSEKKFLERVMLPEDGSTRVALGKKRLEKSKEEF